MAEIGEERQVRAKDAVRPKRPPRRPGQSHGDRPRAEQRSARLRSDHAESPSAKAAAQSSKTAAEMGERVFVAGAGGKAAPFGQPTETRGARRMGQRPASESARWRGRDRRESGRRPIRRRAMPRRRSLRAPRRRPPRRRRNLRRPVRAEAVRPRRTSRASARRHRYLPPAPVARPLPSRRRRRIGEAPPLVAEALPGRPRPRRRRRGGHRTGARERRRPLRRLRSRTRSAAASPAQYPLPDIEALARNIASAMEQAGRAVAAYHAAARDGRDQDDARRRRRRNGPLARPCRRILHVRSGSGRSRRRRR